MEALISACGLMCSRCDAFRATRENDSEKLEAVAADWRARYNSPDIAADNIRCDGCMTDGGPKCGHCGVCAVRKCASEKKLTSCAQCAEFPCRELSDFHKVMGPVGVVAEKLLRAQRDVEGSMHSAF